MASRPLEPLRPDEGTPEDAAAQLASVRSILLVEERDRIAELAEVADAIRETSAAEAARLDRQVHALREQLVEVESQLTSLREALAEESSSVVPRVTVNLDEITHEAVRKAPHEMAEALGPVIGDATRMQIHRSRDKMVEALGPIIGESIQVQIRESNEEMVEALHPVIGASIVRSVNEAIQELRRSIDARMQSVVRQQNPIAIARARLQGVSAGDLALRNALPYEVRLVFLIQRDSGLLLFPPPLADASGEDYDLIGGMLTAIRDFAQDAFGDQAEDSGLDEIQYGDERIFVASGTSAYVAVVLKGHEPKGFRNVLRSFVSDLHLYHRREMRDYDGDMASLPGEIADKMAEFHADLAGVATEKAQKPLSRRLKVGIGATIFLLLTAVACGVFYIWLAVRLFPLAVAG